MNDPWDLPLEERRRMRARQIAGNGGVVRPYYQAQTKDEREEQRRLNREAWEKSPKNANSRWFAQHEKEKVAREIAYKPPEDDRRGEDVSGSLQRLRGIMANQGAPLWRRMDAAEVVLTYELAPGAAAGMKPEHIAAESYNFLRSIAEDTEIPESIEFRALKSIAAVENARAAIKSNAASHQAKRELLVALINAERRRAMREKGQWPPPVGMRWALSVADDFAHPSGWPGTWPWPPPNIAENLEKEADVEWFREALRP